MNWSLFTWTEVGIMFFWVFYFFPVALFFGSVVLQYPVPEICRLGIDGTVAYESRVTY